MLVVACASPALRQCHPLHRRFMGVWTALTALLLTSGAETPGAFAGSRSRALLRMMEFPLALPRMQGIALVAEVMFVIPCSALESR